VSRTATADYDTGGKYQKVVQAVTAAMQGLAGGNLAQAASGAVSPYVAEIIHSQTTDSATGKVNVEANAMAHAVWGAIAAASGNNSALAGAAGAVSGELLGRWIAAEYYPDVKTEELSDEQKSTISALSTLAAGLMGGLSGGSSADAVAGAQAGKNAVENNAFGASAGTNLGFWFSQTPDCDTDCKGNLAENVAKGNAVVSAHLAGTVGLGILPKGALITAAIGGGANTAIQYATTREVNYTDALIATWVGAATSKTGWLGTVGWNAAGGATSSYIKGDDPIVGAITSSVGSGLGYGVGKYILKPSINSAGKWITGGWDPKFDHNWLKYTEIKGQLGLSKEMLPSRIPTSTSNMGSSITSEMTGTEMKKIIEDKYSNGGK
ncbi:VENN motif pre-toxin domain-containing protein, partial [Klebsiella aerogenes]